MRLVAWLSLVGLAACSLPTADNAYLSCDPGQCEAPWECIDGFCQLPGDAGSATTGASVGGISSAAASTGGANTTGLSAAGTATSIGASTTGASSTTSLSSTSGAASSSSGGASSGAGSSSGTVTASATGSTTGSVASATGSATGSTGGATAPCPLLVLSTGTGGGATSSGSTSGGAKGSGSGGLVCSTVSVTTLAGNGQSGWVDGSGGPLGTAEFETPSGIAIDSCGNLWVADEGDTVRKVTAGGMTSTYLGDANANRSSFSKPDGVALDLAGDLFVSVGGQDVPVSNNVVLASPAGVVSILVSGVPDYVQGLAFDALTGNVIAGFGNSIVAIALDGGTTPLYSGVTAVDLAVDSSGNVYATDQVHNRIVVIDPAGELTILAGNGTAGFVDGSGGDGGTAEFNRPWGVAVDGAGNVYVADQGNRAIRKVSPDGTTVTLAGNVDAGAGTLDGNGCVAKFFLPQGIAVDGSGNVYVTDIGASRIRRLQQ